jgi:hypothetical protein
MLYRASRSFVMLYRMFDICFDKLYDVLIRDLADEMMRFIKSDMKCARVHHSAALLLPME